jgi:hypothetical protein
MSTAPPAALRSVYLWAGRATVDLLRVKLPDLAVDAPAHEAAHSPEAARELAACGLNTAFLSMNWGFPPELEEPHWQDFARAARIYREAGMRVLGYVQASNCVVAGSYAARDWYARTPRGKFVPYYHGRRMTCWNHPGWIEEVRAHALRVLELGGDGVFFDNLWMGATAWVMGGAVGGFAGCACERCAAAYRQASGAELPRRLGPGSNGYLRWRASVVAQRFAGWAAAIRERDPLALVVANNCDVILRDSTGVLGIDPIAVGRVQDKLLLENVAMARYDERGRRLVANALPVKILSALAPGRPVLALSYERGIGIDRPPDARRLRRSLAEALAVGASPVLKGTEYRDTLGRMTVITSPDFARVLEEAAGLLRWVGEHAALYRDSEPAPLAGVYCDAEGLRERWAQTAPATFAVAIALVRAGIPFAFLTSLREAAGPVLLPPGVAPPDAGARAVLIPVPPSELDVPGAGSRLSAHPWARALADRPLRTLSSAYFGRPTIRRFVDDVGLTSRFLESPLFALPRRWPAAVRLLAGHTEPAIESPAPVLVERWRGPAGTLRWHLVSYADEPITLTLRAPFHAVHSPDPLTDAAPNADGTTRVRLDTYAIVETPSF